MSASLLPVDALRLAIGQCDWDTAHTLLAEHETRLRELLGSGDGAAAAGLEALAELLSAQRGLIEDLRSARDEAGRKLEELGDRRRGVAAYLQGGG